MKNGGKHRLFFPKLQSIIIILVPVVVTGLTFYSSVLGQDISEIETNYVIDVTTLNNSFITLGIKAAQQDKQGFKNVKDDLDKQMEHFNARYEKDEKDRQTKKNLQLWVNRIIYVFLLVQTLVIARAWRQS